MLAVMARHTHATSTFPVEDWSSDSDDESTPRTSMSREAMVKLNEMRVNNQLCDASIEMGNGDVFNVHRAILGACSEYFRTLFTTPLQNTGGRTFVVGVPSAIFEQIIRYAYLRDVTAINDSNVREILITADYFGIVGLLKYCIEFIITTMTTENCVIMWLMSRYRCTQRLMERSRSYILENFVRIAVESKDLLELNIDDFVGIIEDEMLNVKDESSTWECVVRWIDHCPEKRTEHLPRLMKAVRLGLMDNSYFMESVKTNRYVENNPEARPIILETMKFLCDLETLSSASNEMATPSLAVPRFPHEVAFAIGGWSEGAAQTRIETYDTRADRWIRINHEDPSGPRSYHGTAVLGTKLYCIGGFDGTNYFNTCSRFDAAKMKWREIAPMHQRRCYVSVAALDGKIYALGGYDGQSRQNTVERYCPKTNQWTMISRMNFARSDADACVLGGKIFITGGFSGQECLNTSECYDPMTNSWTLLPPMLTRRSGVSCVALGGSIYVIGGFDGLSRLNTGERYDPVQRVWTAIKKMNHPRSNFGLDIIDDLLLAVGGFNGVVTISHCECYVPEKNEWLMTTDMGIIRSALTVNVVRGLPNVRHFVHQHRSRLMEETRLMMMGISSTDLFGWESVQANDSNLSEMSTMSEIDEIDNEQEE